jgi:hypothetical protein
MIQAKINKIALLKKEIRLQPKNIHRVNLLKSIHNLKNKFQILLKVQYLLESIFKLYIKN